MCPKVHSTLFKNFWLDTSDDTSDETSYEFQSHSGQPYLYLAEAYMFYFP